MLSERKYEEAFTTALQRSDVNIVSWLCSQVMYGVTGFCMLMFLGSCDVTLCLFVQYFLCIPSSRILFKDLFFFLCYRRYHVECLLSITDVCSGKYGQF